MKLIAKFIMKMIAKFTRVYGRITVILPLILAIGPLYLPWPSNDIGGGGRSGGIFAEANTSIVGIKYTHPVQGDRLVLVGDRMVTSHSLMFDPLVKLWQKSGQPRNEFDELILKNKFSLLGRNPDDLKVQYMPGTHGNHYAISFTGDHDVHNKFVQKRIAFLKGGGRVESVEKLAKMLDDSFRESKTRSGQPIQEEGFLGADSCDFYWFRVGGQTQVGRHEFAPVEPKVSVQVSNLYSRSWQRRSMVDHLAPKYRGEQKVVATDEEVQADLIAAFGRHSRLDGHYPTPVSHSLEGYRLSQRVSYMERKMPRFSEPPARFGHIEHGEEERLNAIPRIADEDIARNLVRKGWWDPLLEKQPGDDGRILRLWRQLEEEAMASEQRGQLPPRLPHHGPGPSTSGSGDGGGSSSSTQQLGSGRRRSPSSRASSRERGRSTSSTGRNDEAPPVPTHLSRLSNSEKGVRGRTEVEAEVAVETGEKSRGRTAEVEAEKGVEVGEEMEEEEEVVDLADYFHT